MMHTNRRTFLEELNRAFAANNIQFMLDHVAEDFEWRIVGSDVITGKESYSKALSAMGSTEPLRVMIHSIITQGDEASVSGVMYMSEDHYVEFCDVMRFQSTDSNLITRMTSYTIEIKP